MTNDDSPNPSPGSGSGAATPQPIPQPVDPPSPSAGTSDPNAIIDELRMPPRRMMETYVPVKKSGDQTLLE